MRPKSTVFVTRPYFYHRSKVKLRKGNRRREDVALSARRPRNCRPVAPTHDPLWSVARVDVDVLPTNGPRISRQTDGPPRYRDRFPIDMLHHDVERARMDASLSGTWTPGLQ